MKYILAVLNVPWYAPTMGVLLLVLVLVVVVMRWRRYRARRPSKAEIRRWRNGR